MLGRQSGNEISSDPFMLTSSEGKAQPLASSFPTIPASQISSLGTLLVQVLHPLPHKDTQIMQTSDMTQLTDGTAPCSVLHFIAKWYRVS